MTSTRTRIALVAAMLILSLLLPAVAQDPQPAQPDKPDKPDRHRVDGKINFSYDWEATVKAAEANGKPIFAYFTFAT
ncbi:MAG: hypothetical protein AB7K09_03280 [Planctomycetota bacterium]